MNFTCAARRRPSTRCAKSTRGRAKHATAMRLCVMSESNGVARKDTRADAFASRKTSEASTTSGTTSSRVVVVVSLRGRAETSAKVSFFTPVRASSRDKRIAVAGFRHSSDAVNDVGVARIVINSPSSTFSSSSTTTASTSNARVPASADVARAAANVARASSNATSSCVAYHASMLSYVVIAIGRIPSPTASRVPARTPRAGQLKTRLAKALAAAARERPSPSQSFPRRRRFARRDVDVDVDARVSLHPNLPSIDRSSSSSSARRIVAGVGVGSKPSRRERGLVPRRGRRSIDARGTRETSSSFSSSSSSSSSSTHASSSSNVGSSLMSSSTSSQPKSRSIRLHRARNRRAETRARRGRRDFARVASRARAIARRTARGCV